MPHNHYHILMEFFRKKEINQIYLSIFIMTFADSLISIFVPIYLYTLNYPITSIIFYFFLASLSFVIFSIIGARAVSRIGVKHSILAAAPFLILYYSGLKFIQSSNYMFFILPVLLSIAMIFSNYGYHLNFMQHSSAAKRGRQISFIYMLTTSAMVLAPFIAGLIITSFSFGALFITGSALFFIGTVPLFLTKDTKERMDISFAKAEKYIFSKKHFPNTLSFLGYAIESIIGRILWPIFLIMLLLTSKKVGLIVTLSFVTAIALYYIIGRFTDKAEDKLKLIKFGTALYFFGWVGRIFANTAFQVFLVDSYKAISQKVLQIPWGAKSYDIASKENYYMFIVMREVVFNLSRVIVLPVIMLIFYIGFHPFTISFIVAALFTLLYPFLKDI